jgi:hypothetical protein
MKPCPHPADKLSFVPSIDTVPLRCDCGAVISWWKPLMARRDTQAYLRLLQAMHSRQRSLSVLDLFPDANVGPVDAKGRPALGLPL